MRRSAQRDLERRIDGIARKLDKHILDQKMEQFMPKPEARPALTAQHAETIRELNATKRELDELRARQVIDADPLIQSYDIALKALHAQLAAPTDLQAVCLGAEAIERLNTLRATRELNLRYP